MITLYMCWCMFVGVECGLFIFYFYLFGHEKKEYEYFGEGFSFNESDC